MTIDILPTLYAVAGVPLPSKKIDGLNLLPMLQGGPAPARDALYWHFPHYSPQGGFPGAAIRMGDWKLIERFEDGRAHLYNLLGDPGERHDLAQKEPARTAHMRSRLHAWYEETGARFLLPKNNGPKPWNPMQISDKPAIVARAASPCDAARPRPLGFVIWNLGFFWDLEFRNLGFRTQPCLEVFNI